MAKRHRQTKGASAGTGESAVALASLQTPAAPEPEKKNGKRPAIGELGISGTTNWSGRLYNKDPNAELAHEAAFGRSGTGNWGQYEKMQHTDPAISAGLDLVTAPLREANVEVKPAEDVAGGEVHAEFVRDNLTKWMAPGWKTLMGRWPKGAIANGFNIDEKLWATRPDKRVPGGIAYYVRELAERLPSSIHVNGWVEDEAGRLVGVKQSGTVGSKWVEPTLPVEKILLTTWNRSGNNYAGWSVLRPVWFHARVREHLLKVLAIGGSREALGIPIATVDKEAKLTPGQRRRLQVFLENITVHENAAAVMPAGVTLEWVYSTGANKGHVIDTYNKLGLHILEVLQAQQIALGTGETGSRSVGEVHNQTKDAFTLSLKAMVEGVLNGIGDTPYTGLVRDIVRANFGEQDAYPEVVLTLKRADLDPQALVTAAKVAVDAGLLTVTAEDENTIRERLGLSPIDPAEREAEHAKKAAKALEIAGATKGDEDEDESPGEDPPPPTGDADEKGSSRSALSDAAGFTPWRPLHPHEECIDFAAIDDFLTKAKERFEDEARPLVVEMLTKAMPDIAAAMADGDPSEVAKLQLDSARLRKHIDAFLEKLRAEGYRNVRAERSKPPARVAFAAEEEEDDRKDAPEDEDLPEPVKKGRKVLDAQAGLVERAITNRVKGAVEASAIDVIRTGGKPSEVVADVVSDLIESKALRTDAAKVIGKAFNIGREEFAQEYGSEVESVVLSAILDRNTCGPCEALDGEEYEFGSPEHDAHVPPLRDCEGRDACRCLMSYIWREDGA